MSKKLTTEDFLFDAKVVHGDKYDYSNTEYKTMKNKLSIICPSHGVFIQTPEKHLCGRGCPLCGIEKQKNTCLEKYGSENPFSCDVFKKKIKDVMIKKYGGIGASSKEIKERIYNTNLKKYGVVNPFQNKDIIKQMVSKKDYISIHKKIRDTMISKYGVSCSFLIPKSKKKMLENRRETIIDEIFFGNRLDGKVIPMFQPFDYIDVTKKYKFKCNSCMCEFEDHLDDGRIPRCPTCYPYIINSKYEYEIIDFIKSFYSGEILHGTRKILSGKEIDIYLPDKKIGIEFNGLYYHSELSSGKVKNYHLNKTNECNKLGIRLIHIFEDEWRQKQLIVKSRLLSILGGKLNKIYARKCYIKEINLKECNEFLLNNHLQGIDNSSIKLGLYYKTELVSAMTFGNFRLALGNISKVNKWEMYRFCNKLNCSLVGGASKLLNYFIKLYNPLEIISYADKRWSRGDLYEKLKFLLDSETRPGYFYTIDHYKKYHRFNFRKSELHKKLQTFDPNLSEWENMKNNGWDRIWDCGHFKYIWKK
jgi:protein-arginine kinase activator protein McsA